MHSWSFLQNKSGCSLAGTSRRLPRPPTQIICYKNSRRKFDGGIKDFQFISESSQRSSEFSHNNRSFHRKKIFWVSEISRINFSLLPLYRLSQNRFYGLWSSQRSPDSVGVNLPALLGPRPWDLRPPILPCTRCPRSRAPLGFLFIWTTYAKVRLIQIGRTRKTESKNQKRKFPPLP